MNKGSSTRRALLGRFGAALAGTTVLKSQEDPSRDSVRIPGIDELKTVVEFEAVAFAKLTRETYTYTAYGSEGEFTLRRNRQAFDWVELVPRGIVNVSSIKTATQILGTPMNFPIMCRQAQLMVRFIGMAKWELTRAPQPRPPLR
jgi:hypothetical protein